MCVEHACIHSFCFVLGFYCFCSVLFGLALLWRCAVQPFSYVVILCHTDYIQCGEQIVSKNIFPTGHTNLQELHCCQQQLNSIIDSPREENLFALHTEQDTHSTHKFYSNAQTHTRIYWVIEFLVIEFRAQSLLCWICKHISVRERVWECERKNECMCASDEIWQRQGNDWN